MVNVARQSRGAGPQRFHRCVAFAGRPGAGRQSHHFADLDVNTRRCRRCDGRTLSPPAKSGSGPSPIRWHTLWRYQSRLPTRARHSHGAGAHPKSSCNGSRGISRTCAFIYRIKMVSTHIIASKIPSEIGEGRARTRKRGPLPKPRFFGRGRGTCAVTMRFWWTATAIPLRRRARAMEIISRRDAGHGGRTRA